MKKVLYRIFRSKVLPYTLFFIIISQIVMASSMPLHLVHNYRIDYDIIKDNLAGVGATLDIIKRKIDTLKLEKYIILMGDSIAYSGPGSPYQSISYYMNHTEKHKVPVFNVAIPAAQIGDFYTLLLMLDKRGISTDHVVMNIVYGGFVRRDPDPPIVYWLEEDLKRLDPYSYNVVKEDLENSTENKNRSGKFETFLEYQIYSKIPVLKYRDFIRTALERYAGGIKAGESGDTRPWYEKPHLKSIMTGPVYQRLFDPSPLIFDDSNFNVFFLRLIVQQQKDKNLLVFMSPVNKELMDEATSDMGYINNSLLLNQFLQNQADLEDWIYLDLTDSISYHLFSDHMHLTPEGYETLAHILWAEIEQACWFVREAF